MQVNVTNVSITSFYPGRFCEGRHVLLPFATQFAEKMFVMQSVFMSCHLFGALTVKYYKKRVDSRIQNVTDVAERLIR